MTTFIPDRLRILHIVPYYDPAWAYGGPVRAIYELTVRLAARGHEVTVCTTDAYNATSRAKPGEHAIDGVCVIRFPNLSNSLAWSRIFIPRGMRPALRRLLANADVAHLTEFRSMLNAHALPALRRSGIPYVVMPQGSLPAELGRTSIKRVYDALVGRPLLERASVLHALTEMERDQYLSLGAPPDRIFISPNGIDVDAFMLDVDVAAFKREHNIPEGRPVVGFLARLNRIKGPEFLVGAFARVLSQCPEAMLVLVGPDDGERPAIEAQIAGLGIGSSVRFIGYVGDDRSKAAAYRSFDIYVLPSRYEIQGITPLEALLNGVPVITTDRCGLTPTLVREGIGQSVAFGDEAALAASILHVLSSPAEARVTAERGREYVARHFNWDVLTDEWIEVYRASITMRGGQG